MCWWWLRWWRRGRWRRWQWWRRRRWRWWPISTSCSAPNTPIDSTRSIAWSLTALMLALYAGTLGNSHHHHIHHTHGHLQAAAPDISTSTSINITSSPPPGHKASPGCTEVYSNHQRGPRAHQFLSIWSMMTWSSDIVWRSYSNMQLSYIFKIYCAPINDRQLSYILYCAPILLWYAVILATFQQSCTLPVLVAVAL